ncbi:MAG: glycosyltransferase family 4 protein [Lachnospiraceae bacterium]|nr:glycosyltransferase family 4 protein [Lachnospiraceae bacterium]
MKYLIITYDDYFNVPYIKCYEDSLQRFENHYDIVIWNRSGEKVDISNAFVFSAKDSHSKIGKIIPFLRWRMFVIKLLKKNNYDRLIILTTLPAVLLADKLLGKFKNRYWFDIRDFTYENFSVYKGIVGRLVKTAAATSISSPAFRNFLPVNDNIFFTHNISNEDLFEKYCNINVERAPFKIGFVGGIRFVEQNQLLIKQFANNPKYLLKYVGRMHLGCDLPLFCEKNKIDNVEFYPSFINIQKPEIYRSIDVINSIYGDETEIVRLALPNKLYDCALYKKPIMVSKGTYLADVVIKYNLGIAVDIKNEDVVEILERYLEKFDCEKFELGCQNFLESIKEDLKGYTDALYDFCAGE